MQDFPTVSPCCSRIGLKSVITLIATEKWEIKSIDVKTAFLQGKEIQRNVYLRPPVEANTRKVWKLQYKNAFMDLLMPVDIGILEYEKS